MWEADTEQPLEFLEGFGFCDTELLRDTHLKVEKKNKFKLVQVWLGMPVGFRGYSVWAAVLGVRAWCGG